MYVNTKYLWAGVVNRVVLFRNSLRFFLAQIFAVFQRHITLRPPLNQIITKTRIKIQGYHKVKSSIAGPQKEIET